MSKWPPPNQFAKKEKPINPILLASDFVVLHLKKIQVCHFLVVDKMIIFDFWFQIQKNQIKNRKRIKKSWFKWLLLQSMLTEAAVC